MPAGRPSMDDVRRILADCGPLTVTAPEHMPVEDLLRLIGPMISAILNLERRLSALDGDW